MKAVVFDLWETLATWPHEDMAPLFGAVGMTPEEWTDPEHVERYGLQDLARDRNLELEFGLTDEADIEDQVDAKVA